MERGEGVTNVTTLTQRAQRLPTEIIYAIIAYLASEYLDDVIAGPYALPAVDMDAVFALHANVPPAPNAVPQQDANLAAAEAAVLALEFQTTENDQDPARDAPNSLSALLSTNTQIRATALLVLSDALGIPLVREGIHRLTSKPWTRIHMVRVVYSNPMAFVRMSRDHDFTSVMRSSGVITTYVSLGADVFQLGLATRLIDSLTNDDPIVMFVACRARVTALLESLATTLHGPLVIPFEILRLSVYKRVMTWSFDVGKFLVFKIYIPATKGVFELLLKLEETGRLCERAAVSLDVAESTIENALAMLDGMLHALCQASGLVSRLPKQYDGPSYRDNIDEAVELMNKVIEHEARHETKFAECRKVAKTVLDWLVEVVLSPALPAQNDELILDHLYYGTSYVLLASLM